MLCWQRSFIGMWWEHNIGRVNTNYATFLSSCKNRSLGVWKYRLIQELGTLAAVWLSFLFCFIFFHSESHTPCWIFSTFTPSSLLLITGGTTGWVEGRCFSPYMMWSCALSLASPLSWNGRALEFSLQYRALAHSPSGGIRSRNPS